MNEKKPESALSGALWGMIFGVSLGMGFTGLIAGDARKEMERKAVALGAADWIVDPKTGSTTFTWREKK